LPGYRTYKGLSLSPYSPRVGSLPGGVTPGYGAPMPPGGWTFRFTGFLSASFQASLAKRAVAAPDQHNIVFHVLPQTVDEYASFLGTSTMPGQWVALDFSYGKDVVTANVSMNTWNPTDPSTYYQIGSQYFLNNMYLQFEVPPLAGYHIHTRAGYFYGPYGGLGQYGLGMYTNAIIGLPRGVGETTLVDYTLRSGIKLTLEHGIMGNRNGHVPNGVIPSAGNGGNTSVNPVFPSAWIHHLHLGAQMTGEYSVRGTLHYMTNWAQDERGQCTPPPGMVCDNPTSRAVNEAYIKDGRIDVYGFDAFVQHGTWGALGVAGSYTRGQNASLLHGLSTFGGEGLVLSNRWWGDSTSATGKLFAAGLNYSGSLGRIVTAPAPFSSDGPDITLNLGFVLAYTLTDPTPLSGTTDPAAYQLDQDTFNHRLRYKFGAEAIYSVAYWLSFALRGDRVAPTSKDAGETFYVVAPRVIFKTNWMTREQIVLIYGHWFYGPRTHPEASSLLPTDIGLDSNLVALNVNMWW
jgi:hypothetical protein